MEKRKLISIVNAWDGTEFLPFLMDATLPHVEEIIIVYSNQSNFGDMIAHDFYEMEAFAKAIQWEPNTGLPPHKNEAAKRNFGLKCAIERGATHIIMQDVDEFYDADEFERDKELIYRYDLNGLVCGLRVYVKEPTLWCHDHTLVPFIQKVTPGLQFGSFKTYPFAYDKKGEAHIDPTRRTNQTKGIEWSDITMHHYSWVRQHIDMKINNSSAKKNLLKSTIKEDLANAAPGYYCKFYRDTLKECENKFGIRI